MNKANVLDRHFFGHYGANFSIKSGVIVTHSTLSAAPVFVQLNKTFINTQYGVNCLKKDLYVQRRFFDIDSHVVLLMRHAHHLYVHCTCFTYFANSYDTTPIRYGVI